MELMEPMFIKNVKKSEAKKACSKLNEKKITNVKYIIGESKSGDPDEEVGIYMRFLPDDHLTLNRSSSTLIKKILKALKDFFRF